MIKQIFNYSVFHLKVKEIENSLSDSINYLLIKKPEKVYTIGRNENNDILFSSLSISRYHCYIKINLNLNYLELYDGIDTEPKSSSTNGTWIVMNKL